MLFVPLNTAPFFYLCSRHSARSSSSQLASRGGRLLDDEVVPRERRDAVVLVRGHGYPHLEGLGDEVYRLGSLEKGVAVAAVVAVVSRELVPHLHDLQPHRLVVLPASPVRRVLSLGASPECAETVAPRHEEAEVCRVVVQSVP